MREMWDQLTIVKESKGQLGILATWRALYRATAEEVFNMIGRILNLRKLQEELHLMDNKIAGEDFVMFLITSLPESWDNYTSSYLGSEGNMPELSSHELIAILMEEDRWPKGRSGDSTGTSLQAKHSRVRKIINQKLTQIPNVIIATKRVTWQVIVGPKKVEKRDKGQIKEIDQIRHRKQTQI